MSTNLTTSEMVERAKEDFDAVYDAGYEKGKAEGNDNYYDTFWDMFQNHGQPGNYCYAFSYERFDDTSYNPKYPIVCNNTSNAAQGMFYASLITDTKVPIDLTRLTYPNGVAGIFSYAYQLITIHKFILAETSPGITIGSCRNLTNITIEGTCGNNFAIGECPKLTRESMLSILNSLSTNVTGKTVTFSQIAKEAAFTDEEWKALTDAKPNWTFTLQ